MYLDQQIDLLSVCKRGWALAYRNDPVGYCEDVLGQTLTEDQKRIATRLTESPYKVLVKAAHTVGKSYLAACLTLWWYDTRDPGLVITTAPTQRQVVRILWKEIRDLRGNRGGFAGPKAPLLSDSDRHYATGMVARIAEGFQGQHEEEVLCVIDEAVGVDEAFWTASETMLSAAFAICNPTNTSSYAYQAEQSGTWTVETLSAVDHPNIAAELAGEPPPFPRAIRLARLNDMLQSWCDPVSGPPQAGDLEWPPGSGKWLRPGPEAEARLLGRWPSQAVNAIWGEGIWQACLVPRSPDDGPLEIGVDVARFGDDYTVVHVRKGPCSLDHQSRNGYDNLRVAELVRDTVEHWAPQWEDPQSPPQARLRYHPKMVPIKIDDSSMGGGVTDLLRSWGYRVIPCYGANAPVNASLYPNRRSEGWFLLRDKAKALQLSFSRLPAPVQHELRRQFLGVTYSLDDAGRRVVERKEDTKDRLKRSPDDSDAVMLAYGHIGREAKIVSLGG